MNLTNFVEIMEALKKSYKDVAEIYAYYWRRYGGIKQFIVSPYLHVSILLTVLMHSYWGETNEWANDAISIIPSILGFSLGGYAIFLAFADNKFIDLLVDDDADESVYLGIHTHFIHFINIQVISILLALLSKAFIDPPVVGIFANVISACGFFIFIYALLTASATAYSLLRIGRMYNQYKSISDNNDNADD